MNDTERWLILIMGLLAGSGISLTLVPLGRIKDSGFVGAVCLVIALILLVMGEVIYA